MEKGGQKPRDPAATPALVWFREDLRLADNPALSAAADSGAGLVCLYVLDEESPGIRRRGGASRWWLHHSLASLAADLEAKGARLVLRRGPATEIVPEVAAELNTGAVFCNRRYGGAERAVDAEVEQALTAKGIAVETFSAKLLHEPSEVRTQSGNSFRVYTHFWRAAQALLTADPLPVPRRLRGSELAESDRLEDWRLLPKRPDWAAGFRELWQPGERQATERLQAFLRKSFAVYAAERDLPAQDSTSRLSPHLAFGEISPRQIWAAVEKIGAEAPTESVQKLRSEIGWREFAWHLLFHNPDFAEKNFAASFDAFRWAEPGEALTAWQQGRTGYPIVDAAMRQLWQTGWMHNRLRLVAASFLVKHLLIDWCYGEAWFWDTLVDADAANNAVNWQWVAGSGADPAPYFRIFNPVLQGEKFDPEGAFVRRFAPELARLPAKHIHAPWKAPATMLSTADVRLGETYPLPIVEHGMARARALAAFQAMRSA